MNLAYITDDDVRKATLESTWEVINRHIVDSRGKPHRFVRGVAISGHHENHFVNPAEISVSLPIPFLWAHEAFRPIGKIVSLERAQDAITFKAQLMNSGGLEWAEDCWRAICVQQIVSCSIGRSRRVNRLYGKEFADAVLEEVSLVEAGRDPGARICKAWERVPVRLDGGPSETIIWDEQKGPALPEVKFR
jgi:hypothetical protein